MSLQQSRLKALIEYTQQSALLKDSPRTDVAKHNIFTEYEQSICDLPGVRLDPTTSDESDEVWLRVERLQEAPAPIPESNLLNIWVELTNNPSKEPTLRAYVEAEKLVAIGAMTVPEGTVAFDPKQLISFEDFQSKASVEAQFKSYVSNVWEPWGAEEKRRRRTISLYSRLFTLKQQLEGGIVDSPIELVWGIGIVVWKMEGSIVSHPLITKLVELSLNQTTMAIEARPRNLEPRVELEIFANANNPSVPNIEKIAKEFFSTAEATVSPFDRSSFEGLLRSAATHLDSKGVYWPTQVTAEDRTVPKPTEDLKITDTWVLFARPKSASVFIHDLEQFKTQLGEDDAEVDLPDAIRSLITEPSTELLEHDLPNFRGISLVDSNTGSDGAEKTVQDLFFPMPFNDEQVQIVKLLECNDGVVVQGPPGTGKTHTIANVICHYLALGKKVLVTSMKDPALSVLKEKLPTEIQSLAISVLTTEQDGMKQFEHAISKIASEVQRINRSELAQEIAFLEQTIDSHHARLAKIDSAVTNWATKNLSRINLDGEQLSPKDAAEEVVANQDGEEWLPDAISVGPEFKPQFDENDIVKLREARRELGNDIIYLYAKLPNVALFPEAKAVIQVHQDLVKLSELNEQVIAGDVPALANGSQEIFAELQSLSAKMSNLKLLRQIFKNSNNEWTSSLLIELRRNSKPDIFDLLETLGNEMYVVASERKQYLARPVAMPDDCERNETILEGLGNLAQNKRPFGIAGLVSKSAEKKLIDSIRIVNQVPQTEDDWQHVLNYALHLRAQRNLLTRWNSLAVELKLPTFGESSTHFQGALETFALFQKVKEADLLERDILSSAVVVLPNWPDARLVRESEAALEECERISLHHLTQNRLNETWALKERFQQVLDGCNGRIVEDIRAFLAHALGNPSFAKEVIQAQWSALLDELRRVQNQSSNLHTIGRVAECILASGAPKWAEQIATQAQTGAIDSLLPSNWSSRWRLKRLRTHLNSVDGRSELKKLSHQRVEAEADLSRTYQDIITKRTWLRLHDKANPTVKAALNGYLAAMAKIGKGTGKRAIRYRQDARRAALTANPAIPCWIMRHDRVAETLPPQFGCFDLVIIDEASQSDLTALPAILRAKKILVVGDDKQVSPEGVGLEEEKIRNLMSRYLASQVELYRAQMSPDRSIYDLFKVVLAGSGIMLREHFRCVAAIIEYSKREVYNHELMALRLPKSSERLDPPLVDVLVEDGFRRQNSGINLGEAKFIVNEIKALTSDPKLAKRTIGVVSLLGDKQAIKIWEMLEQELGPDVIERHSITCGDAKNFQGKERDIMFLSMVVSRDNASANSRDTFKQRYNVAASRARDKMYLVRSITVEDLSPNDELRRNLINHFKTPFAQDASRVTDLRSLCESPFEREMYDLLTERGYRVTPQVPLGSFRIDMVVEGNNDARLAVECDGDQYHGLDKWEDDMRRQRILERTGLQFWRCFASTFVMNRHEVVADLLQTLTSHGVEPLGATEFALSPYVEHRQVSVFKEAEVEQPEINNVDETAVA